MSAKHVHTHTPLPTIFVQIPSYRDADCTRTVQDLYANAAHPERISAGICWQYQPDLGEQPLALTNHPLAERVRIININAAESNGICWAKHQAQSLWQGEDYILQIDSHTRFVPGWDVAMLEELAACNDARGVISAPPPGFTLPRNLRNDTKLTFRAPADFAQDGLLRLKSDFFTKPLDKPVRNAFVAPRFIFSKAAMIQDVPADPYIYIEEEEVTLSARLWTHGWQVFAPRKHLLFHLYNNDGKQRPLHWKDHHNWSELKNRSRQRYRFLLGMDTPKPHDTTNALDKYGLGTAKKLADYEQFCGISFSSQGPTSHANDCPFLQDIKPYSTITHYWLKPAFVPAPPAANINKVPAKIEKNIPTTSHLSIGDLVPYFDLPDQNGVIREIQLYVGKPVLLYFLPPDNLDYARQFFAQIHKHFPAYQKKGMQRIFVVPAPPAILKQWQATLDIDGLLWMDDTRAVCKLFGIEQTIDKEPVSYLLNENLKIINTYHGNDLSLHTDKALKDSKPLFPSQKLHILSHHAPVLVIPDAVSQELCREIIDYWQIGEKYEGTVGVGKNRQVRTKIKRRKDVDIRDKVFLERLDDLLSKAVLPEMRKISSIEITHREIYKIGCYSAEDAGHYGQHRDTSVLSLAHRRYSMSLCLNDDFEGGGLNFPEYGPEVYRVKAGTAIIFPSTLMHRVLPVTKGQRYVMVSFFFGEEEAAFRSHHKQSLNEKDDTEDARILRKSPKGTFKESAIYTQHIASSIGAVAGNNRSDVTLATVDRPVFSNLVEARKLLVRSDVPPGVLVIDNYLNAAECKVFTSYADRMSGRRLEVLDNEKSTHGKTVTRPSDSRITEYVSIDGIAAQALPLFIDIYGTVLSSFYDVDFEWFERPQMLRYPPGGKYNQHADAEHLDKTKNEWIRAQDRDYSILVYLNEEYEGGELELTNFNFRVKPTTGMLLAFPSDHRYLHAALPTTSGIRYALVSWAATLGTKRVKERPPYAVTYLKLKP